MGDMTFRGLKARYYKRRREIGSRWNHRDPHDVMIAPAWYQVSISVVVARKPFCRGSPGEREVSRGGKGVAKGCEGSDTGEASNVRDFVMIDNH